MCISLRIKVYASKSLQVNWNLFVCTSLRLLFMLKGTHHNIVLCKLSLRVLSACVPRVTDFLQTIFWIIASLMVIPLPPNALLPHCKCCHGDFFQFKSFFPSNIEIIFTFRGIFLLVLGLFGNMLKASKRSKRKASSREKPTKLTTIWMQ